MGNFSRDTFNKLKHYVGVRLQQGVPIVDADWNELEDIRKYELRAFLKWFVGDGIPQGNDGFAILPATGEDKNFVIKGGDGTAEGAGRCLVDGWDVLNESDRSYTSQRPYKNTELANSWHVDVLPELSSPTSDRSDLVYLDVWEREVNESEDPHLVNEAIGIPTCVRIKCEWVVRVLEDCGERQVPANWQGKEVIKQGHGYYPLALLLRKAGESQIDQIADLRRTGLGVLSKELTIKDGNVGIGTNSPQYALDVKSSSAIKFGLEGKGGGQLILGNNPNDNKIYLEAFNTAGDGSADELLLTGHLARNVPKLSLLADTTYISGKVGIGTVTPNEKLSVEGNILFTNTTISKSGRMGVDYLGVWMEPQDADSGIRLNANPGLIGLYVRGTDGNVGIGTTSPEAKLHIKGELAVNGDIAIQGKHAFRGNDDWLRLNQDRAFPSGVHTPGVFAPMSLNVGGAEGWGDPGRGNVWILRNLSVNGDATLGSLAVNTDIAIQGKHAFRGSDSWLRLNQDGAFPSGVHTPGVFAPMCLNVGGARGWGDPGMGNVWITGNLAVGGGWEEWDDPGRGNVWITGNLSVTGAVSAVNTLPLHQQLVHRRILFGLPGDSPLSYNNSTDWARVRGLIYGPFHYAVPAVQAGAIRRFRLYAIYSDNMTSERDGVTVVRFDLENDVQISFSFGRTWGDPNIMTDRYSYEWCEGSIVGPGTVHGSIYIRTTSESVTEGTLWYLELQAYDFF